MPAHQHALLLCACGAVVAQCRCPDAYKVQRVVVQQCVACTPKPPAPPTPARPPSTFVWDDAPPGPDVPLTEAERAQALALVHLLRAELERM